MVVVVALNVAVVAAAATVTEAGTASAALLLERVTLAPPDGAAALRVTVHALDAFCPRLVGLQASEETVGNPGPPPVTVPPVADIKRAFPEGEDATGFVTLMAVEVAPAAMVKFRTATTPLEMMLAFIPEMRQV
jgi:hypothetical protein